MVRDAPESPLRHEPESLVDDVLQVLAASEPFEILHEQFSQPCAPAERVSTHVGRHHEVLGGPHRAVLRHRLLLEHVERRARDIAHRRTALTGVNEYPDLAEVPLPQGDPLPHVRRYAADFEALRDRSDAHLQTTGARPTALLLPLGPLAEHNIRATFAVNLLASGGIEAVNPGPLTADDVGAAVADTASTEVAVICGTDARYSEEAGAVVDAARAAGVRHVLLAGPEKVVAEADSKPDGYLTMKIDAVSTLSDLLTRLGA